MDFINKYYSKYLAYNVKDVTLVEDLEDKLGLLELTTQWLTMQSVITQILSEW